MAAAARAEGFSMSEDFSSKEYGGYFAEIEGRLEKGAHIGAQRTSLPNKPSAKHLSKSKAKKGAVIRIKPVYVFTLVAVLAAAIIGVSVLNTDKSPQKIKTVKPKSDIKSEVYETKENLCYPKITDKTLSIDSDIYSKNILFAYADDLSVIAERNCTERCFPASTTKIMTALVALEIASDLEDTFTMTYEITDPLYKAEATVAGFLSGEVITVKDMLYGTILPSGGDAALGLAIKLCGSEKDFVKLMNKKAKDLKLKDTHFTNCTGLFDNEHYSNACDLAVIMKEALKSDLIREIMSTVNYTTSITPQHPEGITLQSTLFSYMYGTEPEIATITAGKTGYVSQSGYCFVTAGSNKEGREYICVTLAGAQRWPSVFDQINLYKKFAE